MSINSIGSAWRSNLKTGGQTDRDERLYVDFRGKDYPDLRDKNNFIDRGDCESTTPPVPRGEVADIHSNNTAARSDDRAHTGEYSWKTTKTVAAGTVSVWYMVDAVVADDMHGFLPGETAKVCTPVPVMLPVCVDLAIFHLLFKNTQTIGSVLSAILY